MYLGVVKNLSKLLEKWRDSLKISLTSDLANFFPSFLSTYVKRLNEGKAVCRKTAKWSFQSENPKGVWELRVDCSLSIKWNQSLFGVEFILTCIFCGYSVDSIKRTVLLNVLLQKKISVSIKRTVYRKISRLLNFAYCLY